jgi:hypothetical protein
MIDWSILEGRRGALLLTNEGSGGTVGGGGGRGDRGGGHHKDPGGSGREEKRLKHRVNRVEAGLLGTTLRQSEGGWSVQKGGLNMCGYVCICIYYMYIICIYYMGFIHTYIHI